MEAALTPMHEVKRASGFLVFLGIVLVFLGLVSIGSPMVGGLTVEWLVSILLIVGGFFRIILAFRAKSWGSGLLAFFCGLVTLACGVLMMVRPIIGLTALTLLLAIYFLVEGFFQIILAFNWKPLKGWGWTLFSGITSLALGYLIYSQYPLSGAWAIGILVGVNLVMVGISILSLGFAGRSISKAAIA